MCGCMLMHATMNHEEHQPVSQPGSAPLAAVPAASGRQCAHCGFSLRQGFAFCPNCGMRLQETKCPACGQISEAIWKTCAYCGSPLGQTDGQRMPA
ncbi:MAG: zinc ribbon domain-containing protein [Anaerolineales bacterium]|nr:zinc ribbon domain-containing protein [Anaerolineales bacterium]